MSAGEILGITLVFTYPNVIVDTSCCYEQETNFDLKGISDLIDRYSVEMKYYQATICSCIAANAGHPATDCDCANGFRYLQNPVTVNLLRTSVNYRALPPDQAGLILQGGCQITVPRCIKGVDAFGKPCYQKLNIYDTLNIGDVFVITGRTRRDRDILKKGTRDIVRAFDIQEIVNISLLGTQYIENIDYNFISYNGQINWIDGGNHPADGEHYTVEFLSKIQYVVWRDLTTDRGSSFDALPKKIICSLRNFINPGENSLDKVSV